MHRKDHNHDNNPPDGSNCELLRPYCHDDEHSLANDADRRNRTLDPQVEAASARIQRRRHPSACLLSALAVIAV